MNENINENFIWKGTNFWKEEIKKAGVLKELKFFNDVITEPRPPHEKSGYSKPVLTDIILDGKKTDIYHSDKTEDNTFHRIFIHIKE